MQSTASAITASLLPLLLRQLTRVLMPSTDANAADLSTNSGLRTVTSTHNLARLFFSNDETVKG